MEVRNWKPWTRSTGSLTASGKATVARNAYKGSERTALRKLARVLRELIGRARDLIVWRSIASSGSRGSASADGRHNVTGAGSVAGSTTTPNVESTARVTDVPKACASLIEGF
jgi:hypothetical protein